MGDAVIVAVAVAVTDEKQVEVADTVAGRVATEDTEAVVDGIAVDDDVSRADDAVVCELVAVGIAVDELVPDTVAVAVAESVGGEMQMLEPMSDTIPELHGIHAVLPAEL